MKKPSSVREWLKIGDALLVDKNTSWDAWDEWYASQKSYGASPDDIPEVIWKRLLVDYTSDAVLDVCPKEYMTYNLCNEIAKSGYDPLVGYLPPEIVDKELLFACIDNARKNGALEEFESWSGWSDEVAKKLYNRANELFDNCFASLPDQQKSFSGDKWKKFVATIQTFEQAKIAFCQCGWQLKELSLERFFEAEKNEIKNIATISDGISKSTAQTICNFMEHTDKDIVTQSQWISALKKNHKVFKLIPEESVTPSLMRNAVMANQKVITEIQECFKEDDGKSLLPHNKLQKVWEQMSEDKECPTMK